MTQTKGLHGINQQILQSDLIQSLSNHDGGINEIKHTSSAKFRPIFLLYMFYIIFSSRPTHQSLPDKVWLGQSR